MNRWTGALAFQNSGPVPLGRGFKASFCALNLAVRYYDLHVASAPDDAWRVMA